MRNPRRGETRLQPEAEQRVAGLKSRSAAARPVGPSPAADEYISSEEDAGLLAPPSPEI